ncbi:hypothetical protein JVU11DRAFT_771 [Chiua virens]|nr:hypothetical protein JVU11DRAFT_771 [Chiua virens]
MAVAREKQRAHRAKKLGAKSTSIKLVEPIAVESPSTEKRLEKIKVPSKSRSALVKGDGQSMAMDVD